MASREGHTSMGGGTSSPGRIGITQLTVYLMQQSLRLTSSHRYSHIYLYPPFRLKKALRYSRQVSPLKQYRTKRADEEKSKPKAKMLVCGKKIEKKKPRQTVVCQYVLRWNISKIVVKPTRSYTPAVEFTKIKECTTPRRATDTAPLSVMLNLSRDARHTEYKNLSGVACA